MICSEPNASTSRTWPRRAVMSPSTSPKNCSGVRTSIFMIGSSRTGSACSIALRMPSMPAMRNASSDESDLDVDHGVAADGPRLQRVLDAALRRPDVLLRDGAADDLVLEDEAAAARQGLHLQEDDAVLAAAARLAHEAALRLDGARKRLAVGDLWPADVGVDAELAQHPVDDDLQVQLAHAGDERLARLLLEVRLEGRVLLRQLAQRLAHLVRVGLRLRLDGDGDDGLREADRLQDKWLRRVGQRVARQSGLEADGGDDIAGADGFDLFLLVGVHAHQAAEALRLVARRV